MASIYGLEISEDERQEAIEAGLEDYIDDEN